MTGDRRDATVAYTKWLGPATCVWVNDIRSSEAGRPVMIGVQYQDKNDVREVALWLSREDAYSLGEALLYVGVD